MYDSLERAKGLLEKLAIQAENPQFHNDPHTALLQAELKEEIAYKYILEVFDKMRAKLEYYRLHFASHPALSENAIEALKLSELQSRFIFLKDTATVNQLLIAQSVALEKANGLDISAFSPKSTVYWI
jgi:hypothetical protein